MATAPVPVIGPFQGQRTLQPGMRVRIGAHLVTVSRFLSSGGFAQVYLCLLYTSDAADDCSIV